MSPCKLSNGTFALLVTGVFPFFESSDEMGSYAFPERSSVIPVTPAQVYPLRTERINVGSETRIAAPATAAHVMLNLR